MSRRSARVTTCNELSQTRSKHSNTPPQTRRRKAPVTIAPQNITMMSKGATRRSNVSSVSLPTRGSSRVEACVSVTIVIEQTSPGPVITAPAGVFKS